MKERVRKMKEKEEKERKEEVEKRQKEVEENEKIERTIREKMVRLEEESMGGAEKGIESSFWAGKMVEEQMKERAKKLKEKDEMRELEIAIKDSIELNRLEAQRKAVQESLRGAPTAPRAMRERTATMGRGR